MQLSRYLRAGAPLLVLSMLTACGGGGGGGGGGTVAPGGAGGGGGGGGATLPIVYRGNSNPAVITTSNAGQLSASVLGAGNSSSAVSSLTGSTDQRSGQTDIGRRLDRVAREAMARSSAARSRSAIAVDESVPCDTGAVHYSGSLNDNGTGTLSVTYFSCRTGEQMLNGAATMRVDASTVTFLLDYTLSFERLTLHALGGVIAELGGSVRVHLDVPTRTQTYNENIAALEPSGRMTKSENLVFTDIYNDVLVPTYYTETISGRVYDSLHGFVSITTGVPLMFNTMTQSSPDSGQITLTGAGNGQIRLTSFSTTSLSLALDLNGDNTYEIVAMLSWAGLYGPMSADLSDSDGDGMHNSFESVNGFNPFDPADAALDFDGDGASNLVEYMAGTNPRQANETPQGTSVELSATYAPDPVTVGAVVTYPVTVRNRGNVNAQNVVVTDTLPASFNLVSASTTQGSCTTTAPVVCNLGTIFHFSQVVTLTIAARPTAVGVFNNTVSVTTTSFDTNSGDNVVSMTTTAGDPVAGIQGRIDVAAPGEVIVVTPGIYYGELDFRGKDVVLRSSAGPATTIIHGNKSTAVRIGPGGTISGFTITGGSGHFGAVWAFGAGSVITGNVFDGNTTGPGSAGIGGDSASPIIERNIFRNHICDDQYISGVVAFVNMSSPVIVNNVFENNQCRAVNLLLPVGNSALIANNTFVANRSAVRVDRRVSQLQQVFRNNIIFQNGIGLQAEYGTEAENPVWTNNLVFGNTTDYLGIASQTGVNANLSVDPAFMNPSAGNYPLRPGSPAIDAGATAGAPAVDFSGAPRPRDGDGDGVAAIDIGAFEAP